MTSANTPEMMVHPVLALRSARSGSLTVCSARTTHRGHPMWRLVHQLSSTQLHQTTQLHALSLEPVTSVVRQATTPVSVPRTSSRIRMLHPVPEATTMVMASRPSLVTPSGRLRCSVAVISLSKDTKVEIEPVGLQERQEGVNGARN